MPIHPLESPAQEVIMGSGPDGTALPKRWIQAKSLEAWYWIAPRRSDRHAACLHLARFVAQRDTRPAREGRAGRGRERRERRASWRTRRPQGPKRETEARPSSPRSPAASARPIWRSTYRSALSTPVAWPRECSFRVKAAARLGTAEADRLPSGRSCFRAEQQLERPPSEAPRSLPGRRRPRITRVAACSAP